MKKMLFVVTWFCMLLSGVVFAEECEENKNIDFTSYYEQRYINYLDAELAGYDSRVEYLSIDQNIVDSCSTEELLELMLSCPMLCNINVYNTREEGLESLIRDYNYFEEFVSRSDAFEVALNAYSSFNIPTETILDYDLIIREETKALDINLLANNKSLALYVLRDSRVEFSVETLETVIEYLADDKDLSRGEVALLSAAIDGIYAKECASEYYDYGARLSDFAKDKEAALSSVLNVNEGWNQNSQGTRYVINNYTVFTHNGAPATAVYRSTQTANSAYSCAQTASSHNATLVDPSVTECNCHSYAFLSTYSSYSSSYKHIWLEDIDPFFYDGYYHQVTNSGSSHAQQGDIASGGSVHTGILYAYHVLNNNTHVPEEKIKSKWGSGGIYIAFESDEPYTCTYHYYRH